MTDDRTRSAAVEWHVQDVGTVKISEHGGVAFSTCCPNHWLVCTAAEARQFAKALESAAENSAKLRGETMSNNPAGTEPLINRLVTAAVETLQPDDPVVTISIGDNEIRIGWAH